MSKELSGNRRAHYPQSSLGILKFAPRLTVSTLAAGAGAQLAISEKHLGTCGECFFWVLICVIDVVSSFSQLIQKGTKLVLEQVVTSIASVADTAEEKFVPYYDLFMPSLKHIVENAVQKELRLLRGKTIECISLIGLAVGKEKVSDM